MLLSLSALVAATSLCPDERHDLTTVPSELVLSQSIKAEMVEIELNYEGRAWLGFGFNQNGQMVGSTVVIGVPEEEEEEEMDFSDISSNSSWANATSDTIVSPTVSPAGRYFLGSKGLSGIERIGTTPTLTPTAAAPTPTPSAATTPKPTWARRPAPAPGDW